MTTVIDYTTPQEQKRVADRAQHIEVVMREVTARTTKEVPVSEALLDALLWAQARHTAELLATPYNRFGDDWGDDTNGALDLMRTLFNMAWDQCDLVALDKWLNTPYDEDVDTVQYPAHRGFPAGDPHYGEEPPMVTLPQLGNIGGTDGYAPELHELDCPALPKEGD